MDRLRTVDRPTGSVEFKTVSFQIPSNVDLDRFLIGAWQGIAFYTSWEKEGTYEPEEMAELVKNVISSRRYRSMLGTVQAVIRETLDTSMLICDGSVYNKSEFPELWAVWPSAMKDASSLTLPDLRNLFLVGSGLDYSLGSSGGAAEVSLTVGQLPSHTHTYYTPTFNIDVESVGVPDPTGVGQPGIPDVTLATGNDEPHPNLPPYYALVYAVVAR